MFHKLPDLSSTMLPGTTLPPGVNNLLISCFGPGERFRQIQVRFLKPPFLRGVTYNCVEGYQWISRSATPKIPISRRLQGSTHITCYTEPGHSRLNRRPVTKWNAADWMS